MPLVVNGPVLGNEYVLVVVVYTASGVVSLAVQLAFRLAGGESARIGNVGTLDGASVADFTAFHNAVSADRLVGSCVEIDVHSVIHRFSVSENRNVVDTRFIEAATLVGVIFPRSADPVFKIRWSSAVDVYVHVDTGFCRYCCSEHSGVGLESPVVVPFAADCFFIVNDDLLNLAGKTVDCVVSGAVEKTVGFA